MVDLRTLKPLDTAAILASVRKTGRVVVAYEGTKTAGVGAEVAALIAEEAVEYLEAPVVRVAAPDVPYPHNAILMQAVMVDKGDIVAGIRTVTEGYPLAELTPKERICAHCGGRNRTGCRTSSGWWIARCGTRSCPAAGITTTSRYVWGMMLCWWTPTSGKIR